MSFTKSSISFSIARLMRVHHLPVRSTFRGTTDIEENFQSTVVALPSNSQQRGSVDVSGGAAQGGRGDDEVVVHLPENVSHPKRQRNDDQGTDTGEPTTAFQARFRGRKLFGRLVRLVRRCPSPPPPSSDSTTIVATKPPVLQYEGAVILVGAQHQRQPPCSSSSTDDGDHFRNDDKEEGSQHPPRSLEVWDRFSEWTSWEHDRPPTAQDTDMVTTWLRLSSCIHGDVNL